MVIQYTNSNDVWGPHTASSWVHLPQRTESRSEVTTPEVVLGTSDAVAPWSPWGKSSRQEGKTYGSMEQSWNKDMFFIEP